MRGAPTVICTYRVRAEREPEFVALLKEHWPTLRRLDLVTGDPPQHYRGTDADEKPVFVEIFTWRDGGAASAAHEHPEVAAVWERMDALVEARGGRPKWEFPHFERLAIAPA